MLSKAAAPISIPTSSGQGFPLLHSLSNTGVTCLIDNLS